MHYILIGFLLCYANAHAATTPRIGTPAPTPKSSRPATPPSTPRIHRLSSSKSGDGNAIPMESSTELLTYEGYSSASADSSGPDSATLKAAQAVATQWKKADQAAQEEGVTLGKLARATDAAAHDAQEASDHLRQAEEEIRHAQEIKPQLPPSKGKPCCRCCGKDCTIL